MGQACSCLQPRRKRERRASDDSTLHDDTDGGEYESDELDILIDSGGSSSSSGASGEMDGLLSDGGSSASSNSGGRLRGSTIGIFTKRSSKSARIDAAADESEYTVGNSSSGAGVVSIATYEVEDQLRRSSSSSRLLGQQVGAALSVEQNLDVLKSYQQVTGVVDEGERDLECVMCLDTFGSDNPRVRTLCSCGVNRTNFHMSCLLEWKNRDAKCPVCREYLFYEDD